MLKEKPEKDVIHGPVTMNKKTGFVSAGYLNELSSSSDALLFSSRYFMISAQLI